MGTPAAARIESKVAQVKWCDGHCCTQVGAQLGALIQVPGITILRKCNYILFRVQAAARVHDPNAPLTLTLAAGVLLYSFAN
jgi:hypothetical protein